MSTTILQKINARKLQDIEEAKQSVSFEEIKKQAASCPRPISFLSRLKSSQRHITTNSSGAHVINSVVAVIGEVKRASPSKGDIAPGIKAGPQGLKYAQAGAAGISVLTEKHWFKGTLDDLREVRQAVEALPHRPALLRKDFILDEYQVYEALVYGADAVLLIVASMDDDLLKRLLKCVDQVGIEALVEVNNADEMKRALDLGAKLIGVNNRNLHDFTVDMGTTHKLAEMVSDDVLLAALSGIKERTDVKEFESSGVGAILVGETLMLADNPGKKLQELVGVDETDKPWKGAQTMTKICGVKSVEHAKEVTKAGADMIGLVFAEGSKRQVSVEQAQSIVAAVKPPLDMKNSDVEGKGPADRQRRWTEKIATVAKESRPLIVGVFANQEAETVNAIADKVPLDIVQLSGSGDSHVTAHITKPVVRAVHVQPTSTYEEVETKIFDESASCILLDTKVGTEDGGSGKAFDWSIAAKVSARQPIMVAGGLSPANVATAVKQTRPWCVDVSSGVEMEGVKDMGKVAEFIANVKSACI